MINMQTVKVAKMLNATHQGPDSSFLGCSTDTRTIREKELFIALRGQNFDGHDYIHKARIAGASAVLTEEKRDELLPHIIVKNTRQAMAELAFKWRNNFSMPLVAITGSNGKTTVKEMLSAILNCQASVLTTPGNFNNNIGVPLTLFNLSDKYQYAIIEMGANHVGEIEYLSRLVQPTIAVITQCAPAHLQGFRNLEGVANAKAEIFSGLAETGTAVINGDDSFADFWLEKNKSRKRLTFGLNDSNDITAQSIQLEAGRSWFAMITPIGRLELMLNLAGTHNIMNVLAAASCAVDLGVDLHTIKKGLEQVRPIAGRLQVRNGLKNSRIIDDTYNANPKSLAAALDVLCAYPGRHWLVLGDMGELGDDAEKLHMAAGQLIKQAGVERLYTLGELTKLSAQAFGDGACHVSDYDNLITLLNDGIASDVTILIKGSRAMAMDRLLHSLGSK